MRYGVGWFVTELIAICGVSHKFLATRTIIVLLQLAMSERVSHEIILFLVVIEKLLAMFGSLNHALCLVVGAFHHTSNRHYIGIYTA